jgi:hypothetical protein
MIADRGDDSQAFRQQLRPRGIKPAQAWAADTTRPELPPPLEGGVVLRVDGQLSPPGRALCARCRALQSLLPAGEHLMVREPDFEIA